LLFGAITHLLLGTVTQHLLLGAMTFVTRYSNTICYSVQ
jgi:hypothetical protein